MTVALFQSSRELSRSRAEAQAPPHTAAAAASLRTIKQVDASTSPAARHCAACWQLPGQLPASRTGPNWNCHCGPSQLHQYGYHALVASETVHLQPVPVRPRIRSSQQVACRWLLQKAHATHRPTHAWLCSKCVNSLKQHTIKTTHCQGRRFRSSLDPCNTPSWQPTTNSSTWYPSSPASTAGHLPVSKSYPAAVPICRDTGPSPAGRSLRLPVPCLAHMLAQASTIAENCRFLAYMITSSHQGSTLARGTQPSNQGGQAAADA